MPTIMVVDDDAYLTDLFRYALKREGFQVVSVDSGRRALDAARGAPVDLILLDDALPDMDGPTALALLRASTRAPIVLLSTRAADEDIVAGLDAGADDYAVKPFNMQVLVMRIRAILRRAASLAPAPEHGLFQLDDATFSAERNEISDGATTIRLTPTQGGILALLLRHEGHALTADTIMERVLGAESESSVNVVKTHIRHLRAKLEQLPGGASLIRTVPGVGYKAHTAALDEAA